MKKDFFDYMDIILGKYPNVFLLMVGLGYPRTQELIAKYPAQAFNTEASEQTALDIAVGLAYDNRIPFVYTITPFLYRGFETIRTFINHENLNVKLIGAGRGDDYSMHDGYSHDAQDISEILGTQKNIKQYYPRENIDMRQCVDDMVAEKRPGFLSLTR